MRTYSLLLIIFLVSYISFGQDTTVQKQEFEKIPESVNDSLYREDQIYVGLTFNLINNEPDEFSQNGFSGGLHLGFIRDMPINKKRNIAIGIGLGYSTNRYNSNLFINTDESGKTTYQIIDDDIDVDRNRLHTNLIEMPIQFRWRTSTPTEYTFWRIYTGVRLGYIFHHKSDFQGDGVTRVLKDIPELEKFRFAATLSIGNGSFNAFVMYNLNPLFNENAQINNDPINLQPIKFGIEFYIL